MRVLRSFIVSVPFPPVRVSLPDPPLMLSLPLFPKTISLSDEAYERLLRRKTGKESFSDVVVRITNNVDILDCCAKIWA